MKFLLAALACAALPACAIDRAEVADDPGTEGTTEAASAADARRHASLSVAWQPVDFSSGGAFFVQTLTIDNHGPTALAAGWHLYFNFVRRILNDGEGDGTTVEDLAAQGLRVHKADAAASGDFYVLEPLADFTPIPPGQQRTVTFLAEAWAILKTDAPAAFHIGFDGDRGPPRAVPATVTIDATDPAQTTRFSGDVMPVDSVATRHAENPARQSLALADRVLPTPRTVVAGRGEVSLRGRVSIERPGNLAREAAYLDAVLDDLADGARVRDDDRDHRHSSTVIRLSVDRSLAAEAYVLDAGDGRIAIRGGDGAGVFHGIQTLRQLVPLAAHGHGAAVPGVHIEDAPGFAFRGMHLDVARHFQSKETVMKVLDLMALYKLNKFHIHLTDDEGWRLEIPGIPELTTFGAHRGHDIDEDAMLHIGLGDGNDLAPGDGIAGKPRSEREANGGLTPAYQGFETATVNFVGSGSGFYTTRDFEDILAYAAERHIDVIPEIDVPGHARAAVQAMEFRARKLGGSARADQFRLLDPDDTSKHTSVQGYTDNFMNPCLDSTYAFLSTIAREIAARYRAAGAPLVAIHGGGDELPSLTANVWWQGSPACAANPATNGKSDPELFNLFFTRWNQIITSTGAAMTGWDDIIHGGLALPGFIPMPWSNVWGWGREDDAYIYANAGSKVVLAHATNLYMDLAYAKDPDEPGYYWANFVDDRKTFEYKPFDIFANGTHDRMGNAIAPSTWDTKVHLTAAGKPNIIGMEGLLWGENVKTPQLLEYMAFPKVLGVAERAWNPEPAQAQDTPEAWAHFANRLGQEVLPRLGMFRAVDLHRDLPNDVGVNYRIPMPGAVITAGTLDANVRYPGLVIEFSTNQGRTWTTFSKPVAVRGPVALRTRAPDGRTSRIAWVQ
ncbi:MAG TPA: family 20 glycosylhydrolase [Kofleriaceae bacterium]|nr:family 20 glycosylhydrolase [Kofleriaceae bacterium]